MERSTSMKIYHTALAIKLSTEAVRALVQHLRSVAEGTDIALAMIAPAFKTKDFAHEQVNAWYPIEEWVILMHRV